MNSQTKSHPNNYQDKLRDILGHHHNHLYIFTDGFKDNDETACVTILIKTVMRISLRKESYIFTAKARAINQAVIIISESYHKNFIISSNSLSVLISLKKLEDSLILKLQSGPTLNRFLYTGSQGTIG